jgi:hypothetical protein
VVAVADVGDVDDVINADEVGDGGISAIVMDVTA